MSKPGGGRYTRYVPVQQSSIDRMIRLVNLFNSKSPLGNIYGNTGVPAPVVDQDTAAKNVTNSTKNYFQGTVKGDPDFFPTGVDLSFGGTPDLTKAGEGPAALIGAVGGPSNVYVPNLGSPGAVPGGTHVEPVASTPVTTDKVKETGAPVDTPQEFKLTGKSVVGSGIVNPSVTAPEIGASSIGNDNLKLGDYVKNK